MIYDLFDETGNPVQRTFRTFQVFPDSAKCPFCLTNDNKPCVLVPLAGQDMQKSNIKAIPIHTSCIENNWVYAKDLGFLVAIPLVDE